MDWLIAGHVARTPLYYIEPAITNGIPGAANAAAGPDTVFLSPLPPVLRLPKTPHGEFAERP